MGLFNYSKPGNGVEKDVREHPFKVFFDVLYRKFWKMIQLNLIYIGFSLPLILLFFVFMPLPEGGGDINTPTNYIYCICCLMYLSVVGIGFITPGFTYVLRNFADETHAFVLGDFWDNVKKHFLKGLVLFIIDLAVVAIMYVCIAFYGAQTNMPFASFAKYFLIFLAVFYFMMHFYIYQIMITFSDMSLLNVMKNALVLTFGHLPRNIMLLIGIAALSVFTFSVSIQFGFTFTLIIAASLIGYLVNFIVLDVINKYAVDEEEI